MGLTIIGNILATVLAGVLLILIRRFWKNWTRQRRKHELYWMKIDCMIYALKSVNHGIGNEFGTAYDEKFEEMRSENDFIDKDS